MSAAPIDGDPGETAAWVALAVLGGILLAIVAGIGMVGFLVLDRGLSLRSPAVLEPAWTLRQERSR